MSGKLYSQIVLIVTFAVLGQTHAQFCNSLCGFGTKCTWDPLGKTYACICRKGFLNHRWDPLVKKHVCTDCQSLKCGPGTFCSWRSTIQMCRCRPGFFDLHKDLTTGQFRCNDVDECDTGSARPTLCGKGTGCQNVSGSYNCTCLSGYNNITMVENMYTCSDIDECRTNPATCGESATCINKPGSHECRCQKGYRHDSENGTKCTDIDECSIIPPPCAENSLCINTPGSYQCKCLERNTTDNNITETQNCTATDICDIHPPVCGDNADCVSVLGGQKCVCHDGYRGNFTQGTPCTDIDECSMNSSVCGENSVCVNTPGSFECRCHVGYNGNFTQGVNCTDIDECGQNLSVCGANSVCLNIPGSYMCQCQDGYYGNYSQGVNCTDIDECMMNMSICGMNSACVNKPGGYECRCDRGYWSNSTAQNRTAQNCTDINECAVNHTLCGENFVCVNTPGSYKCDCGTGYRMNETIGRNCADIDECASGQVVCERNSACVNTPGSYICHCRKGYMHNSSGEINCTDIDECASGQILCKQNSLCTNLPGSYECRCKTGYFQNTTHDNCTDIDECQTDRLLCGENSLCVNTPGGYDCQCQDGYRSNSTDGKNCTKIDLCAGTPLICGLNSECVDMVDHYECQCQDGYSRNLTTGNCSDIDECSYRGLCSENAVCINVPGSYTCQCGEGYQGNATGGKGCNDVDECVRTPAVCGDNTDCINLPGTFVCRCHEGYYMSTRDKTTCTDVDECTYDDACSPFADCINYRGGFNCTCHSGYTGDGIDCVDVDECSGHVCGADTACINTVGSYYCKVIPTPTPEPDIPPLKINKTGIVLLELETHPKLKGTAYVGLSLGVLLGVLIVSGVASLIAFHIRKKKARHRGGNHGSAGFQLTPMSSRLHILTSMPSGPLGYHSSVTRLSSINSQLSTVHEDSSDSNEGCCNQSITDDSIERSSGESDGKPSVLPVQEQSARQDSPVYKRHNDRLIMSSYATENPLYSAIEKKWSKPPYGDNSDLVTDFQNANAVYVNNSARKSSLNDTSEEKSIGSANHSYSDISAQGDQSVYVDIPLKDEDICTTNQSAENEESTTVKTDLNTSATGLVVPSNNNTDVENQMYEKFKDSCEKSATKALYTDWPMPPNHNEQPVKHSDVSGERSTTVWEQDSHLRNGQYVDISGEISDGDYADVTPVASDKAETKSNDTKPNLKTSEDSVYEEVNINTSTTPKDTNDSTDSSLEDEPKKFPGSLLAEILQMAGNLKKKEVTETNEVNR